MKTHPREILIYYNPESSSDRKTIAYAMSISPHVRTYSHQDARVSSTWWRGLIDQLEIEPKKLFNKALPEYQSKLRGKEFDVDGWIHVIQRNPHLLKSPIAVKGKNAVLCNRPTDIYKL